MVVKCGAFILDNDKSHVVLVHERSFPVELRKWGIPKGSMERGESVDECIVREVNEEIGINLAKFPHTVLVEGDIKVIQIHLPHTEVPLRPDRNEVDLALWVAIPTFLNQMKINSSVYNYVTRSNLYKLKKVLT